VQTCRIFYALTAKDIEAQKQHKKLKHHTKKLTAKGQRISSFIGCLAE